MSVAPDNITTNLSLDISAGRRPGRRRQARRSRPRFSFTPMRRAWAAVHALFESAVRARPRTLVLDLPEYTVSFKGPAEFEFALASRTEFPVRKLAALMKRSSDDLQVMASNIRQVEKRFAEALAHSLHEPGLISELLREIELKLFSKDHQWRDIAEALNHQSPGYDVYKRIALVKYLQYLGCRQDVLRNVYLAKVKAEMEASPGSARSPCTQRVDESTMRETAIFHLEQIHMEGDTEGFAFLPRGETLEVVVSEGDGLELLLSSYRLKLYPGERYRLTDEEGQIHILPTGKSVVGRHATADVVVGTENRTISRKHLMIEPVSETTVKLTDLSSHGTSIPVHYLSKGA